MDDKLLIQAIHNILIEIRPLDGSVDVERSLIEYGFDSMSIMQLIVDLEIHFDIVFPEEQLLTSNFSTMNNIAFLVKSNLNG